MIEVRRICSSIRTVYVRACMHGPDTFEDPEKFAPERFLQDDKLDANIRDPYDFVFGFGRRYVVLSSSADTE